MGVGGLMVTANLAPMADSFKIGATALTIALSMNPVANGASRLFWGWVSDRLGREQTMVTAFLIQALSLVSVPLLAHGSDVAFVVCLAMVYFSWGEIYSLFPSLSADIFGTRYASTNYGFLYFTKGVAAIFGGGLAAKLFEKIGTWDVAFYGSAVLAVISAVLAIVVIKMPLPRLSPAANLAARPAEELSARS
jgi:OFA family oxalate/formate antiporter-like MFS transporter